MFEVGVVASFEAAHTLRGDFGPAARKHGHTYRVEVSVRGAALQADGTLCDIGALTESVQTVMATLHYRDLDVLDVFAGRNTTAEAVAQHCFGAIAPQLAGSGMATLAVRVWESPQAYAMYEAPLA
jgi:6-pyruvoyltetrahydropterin/6-carboxytetrahydropterin synthase